MKPVLSAMAALTALSMAFVDIDMLIQLAR